MRYLSLLIILLMLGCRPCDPPKIVEKDKIHDSILNKVPYSSDEIVKLQHSNGHVVNFITKFESSFYLTDCERYDCCEFIYKYKILNKTLTPDYPIFNISFNFSSINIDPTLITCRIANSEFYILTSADNSLQNDVLDSIYINNKFYHNVFRIASNYSYHNNPVFPDSLYYNFEFGIIKIKISNGEYFVIKE